LLKCTFFAACCSLSRPSGIYYFILAMPMNNVVIVSNLQGWLDARMIGWMRHVWMVKFGMRWYFGDYLCGL
jgi:hypothetical protein